MLELVLRAAGAVLLVAGAVVSGHRVHRWLFYRVPWIGRTLPPDAGSWIGLVAGLAAAYSTFSGF